MLRNKTPINYEQVANRPSVPVPAILHSGEVVLPLHLSKRLHDFVRGPQRLMDADLKRQIAKLFTFSPL